MGKYSFIVVFLGVLGLIASVVPREHEILNYADIEPKDSSMLKTYTIYVCEGHFFEWCKEPSTCAYCNESLDEINLWEYYKILECEECQTFFDENYSKFISARDES